MSENIPDFLKPYPMPSYLTQKENQQCCCGTEEEYMGFLISEYGAENIEKLRNGKQID